MPSPLTAAVPLLDVKHEVGLHPHQQLRDIRAIIVSRNQCLHLSVLQADIPSNPDDIPL
jgi:hypothetical protein